jgi:chitinase
VSLGKAASSSVTVHYATANGTAKTPSDYQARSGTLTIAAGATSANIAVPIVGDTVREPNETFTMVLSSPSANARFVDAQGTGTIVNND